MVTLSYLCAVIYMCVFLNTWLYINSLRKVQAEKFGTDTVHQITIQTFLMRLLVNCNKWLLNNRFGLVSHTIGACRFCMKRNGITFPVNWTIWSTTVRAIIPWICEEEKKQRSHCPIKIFSNETYYVNTIHNCIIMLYPLILSTTIAHSILDTVYILLFIIQYAINIHPTLGSTYYTNAQARTSSICKIVHLRANNIVFG